MVSNGYKDAAIISSCDLKWFKQRLAWYIQDWCGTALTDKGPQLEKGGSKIGQDYSLKL